MISIEGVQLITGGELVRLNESRLVMMINVCTVVARAVSDCVDRRLQYVTLGHQ